MDQPVFTTIANRPTKVLHKLTSIDEALVQCRLASGEDVYIPLKELYRLFQHTMLTESRMSTGVREHPQKGQ